MNRTAFPLYSPTGHWSVAAFVRKPQIERFSPKPSITPSIVPNRVQSCPIVPNRAISCLSALQSKPPVWSKSSTSPLLLRQSPSNPVKVFSILHLSRESPAAHTTYCAFPDTIHNQWWLSTAADTTAFIQSAPSSVLSAVASAKAEASSKEEIRNWSRSQSNPVKPVRSDRSPANPPSFAKAADGRQSAIRNLQFQSHPVAPSQTQSHLFSL